MGKRAPDFRKAKPITGELVGWTVELFRLAGEGPTQMKMVFFRHSQTGRCGAANSLHTKLAGRDRDSIGQGSVSESGIRRVGNHGEVVQLLFQFTRSNKRLGAAPVSATFFDSHSLMGRRRVRP